MFYIFVKLKKWFKVFVVKHNFSWLLVRCQDTQHNDNQHKRLIHIHAQLGFGNFAERCNFKIENFL